MLVYCLQLRQSLAPHAKQARVFHGLFVTIALLHTKPDALPATQHGVKLHFLRTEDHLGTGAKASAIVAANGSPN